MDADAKLANAEDAMDHEFDRSANNREDTSDDSGEQPTPPEQTQLEHPPNGPSAAHFREAARLAAARARKAIEKERALEDAPKEPEAAENEPVLNEKTFAKAARKRAMHVSGRDSENEAPSSEQPKKSDSPTASDAPKKSTKAAVSQIDERLMLGARMLRAFESQ